MTNNTTTNTTTPATTTPITTTPATTPERRITSEWGHHFKMVLKHRK